MSHSGRIHFNYIFNSAGSSPKKGYSVFTSKSISDTLMGTMICQKFMQPFWYECRKKKKTWRLLSPRFWQPLQLQIKQLMRRKTAPPPYSPSPSHLYTRMLWQMILFTFPTCPFSDYRFRWITWLPELGPEADDCLWHLPYAIRVKFPRAKWNNCNRVSLTLKVNL